MTAALTTHKALLTALRTRMKGITNGRRPEATVTLTLTRDAVSIDGLNVPAEVPAAAVGTSCTMNGLLLLELLRKPLPTTLISLHLTADDHLGLESGSFQIAFRLSALTRPAAVPVETEPVQAAASAPASAPAKPRQKRPTKRFANVGQPPAYTGTTNPVLFTRKIAI